MYFQAWNRRESGLRDGRQKSNEQSFTGPTRRKMSERPDDSSVDGVARAKQEERRIEREPSAPAQEPPLPELLTAPALSAGAASAVPPSKPSVSSQEHMYSQQKEGTSVPGEAAESAAAVTAADMDDVVLSLEDTSAPKQQQPPPVPVPHTPKLDRAFAAYADRVMMRLAKAQARGLLFPRAPLERIWPIFREAALVMLATVLVVQLLPPAFEKLPAPLHVDPNDPPWVQAQAALAGAGVMVGMFFANFAFYGILYVHRWMRLLYVHIALLVGASFGIPFYLFVVRAAQAANASLDAVTVVVATANFVIPGVLLVQWPPTSAACYQGRRCYAAALATLCSWLLASMSSPTLIAVLGLFALIDVLLVALPCCSPVQELDKLTWARQRSGEPQMPGITYHARGRDGLLLGLGDFIVFSVFVAHAVRGGVAPLAATFVGVMHGLSTTMLHVALQWPLRSLEPAIPMSVAFGAALLAAERFALLPIADALSVEGVWL